MKKKIAITVSAVVFISLILWHIWNMPLDEFSEWFPPQRIENGYLIKNIAGYDFISTRDANGNERLTPLPVQPAYPTLERK